MGDGKRGRTGTRRTTLKVLGILKDSTSRSGPISIAKLVERLETEHGIHTSRDSVKDILNDLIDYYPGPGEIRCSTSPKGRLYQYDYYYQPELPEGLQENIRTIEQTIRKDRDWRNREYRLSFRFSGYGSDHQLHPTESQLTHILPVRIIRAYGHYYLIGSFPGRWDAAHFRIDLMSLIREEEATCSASDREAREFHINRIRSEDYLRSHLYMSYERGETPRHIRLLVKKIRGKPNASLTFLQDTFGDAWRPVGGTETDEQLVVEVECLPYAIQCFVRRYLDRVRVLEPEDIARAVEEDLKRDLEAYFADR